MTGAELLLLVKTVVPECDCPKAGEHIYKLAVTVMERQREDDALIAEQHSQEAAAAIRGA